MDISTLKKNIDKNKYKCSSEFLKDVILIYENSQQYNGTLSIDLLGQLEVGRGESVSLYLDKK